MAGRTVLVLGGGIGGQVTAKELRRQLDPRDRVVVIERSRSHLFEPSLLWLMVGRRRRERIERPLRDLLGRGVELVEAEVASVDPAVRRVETSTGTLKGDALVVALGAESDPVAVPGFGEQHRALGAGYCWVETGLGRAAFADGSFFAEPDPVVTLRRPGRSWHLGKVLFERAWIGGRVERRLAHAGLVTGGRLRGVRVEL